MATLNYAFKELSCKIVYYGCGLCGKTTNLEHIHKTVPGKFRGELVSLATEQDRTLFFDFLPLDLGEVKGFKTKFQLYTVPGQVYYNATRKLVLRGVDGLVFVVDSSRDRFQENIDSLENLKTNLAEYGMHLQSAPEDSEGIPWVLQYNKRDLPDVASIDELNAALNSAKTVTMEAVAYKGQGVKETLKAISTLVIKKLNREDGDSGLGKVPGKPAAPAAAPAPAAPAAAAGGDEFESVSEKELEDAVAKGPEAAPKAGPAPAPAAPEKKAEPKMPEPKAPAKPAAPEKKPEPTTPTLNHSQVCDGYWGGAKKGTANLTIANIVGGGEGEYQLTGVKSFFISKETWSKKLKYAGSEPRMYNGAEGTMHKFDDLSGQSPRITVTVFENGGIRDLLVTYTGFLGRQIDLTPAGKPPLG